MRLGESCVWVYVSRLKNASCREMVYRRKQALLVFRLKGQLRKGRKPVQVPTIDPLDVKSLECPSFQCQVRDEIVDGILRGEVFTLSTDMPAAREFEQEFGLVFFASVKQRRNSPDIRAVWEPCRLQHIAILLGYAIQHPGSFDSGAIKQCAGEAVLTWIKENPFLFGPHYISAMECGLRVPVFFYCLKYLDNLSVQEFRLILDTIYLHAWWISKRLSLYSSLGNHTVCECIGLIFAGAVFRKTREGQMWLSTAANLLKGEVTHQILEDGGPAEQSFSYHRFVLDLYWLAVDFLEINNLRDCSDLKPRLAQGEGFLNAFQRRCGDVPSLGDSDDGYAVAPGLYPKRIEPTHNGSKCRTFSESGYTVVGLGNDACLTFDHGPLGMPPLYNHGHADALSITLSKNGKEILVDPGTYRYNGAPEFRKYFKGTRGHNTVTIDGLDQAVQETGFIWSKPYRTKVLRRLESDEGFLLEAVHDGYSRLRGSVLHKRAVLVFDGKNILIKDSFSGEGMHHFELNYHLHPDAVAEKHDGWWHVEQVGNEIFMKLLGDGDFLFVCGQKLPLLGWYSPSYGIKRKSGVLSCIKRGPVDEVSFLTAISPASPIELEYLQERASLI